VRRKEPGLFALILIALASAAVVAFVGWDRGEQGDPRAEDLPLAVPTDTSSSAATVPGRRRVAIVARGILTPRIVLFGDTVRAQIDVTVDNRRVDPDSVRVAAAFLPWQTVGAPERSRRDAGTTSYVRIAFVLRCLTSPCPPPGQVAPLQFDQAQVRYAPRDGSPQTLALRIVWPVLTVYSRFASVNFEDEQGSSSSAPWRADALTLPAVSYRIPPTLLVALFLGGASILAVGGAVAAYWAWPREASPPPPEPPAPPEPTRTPLELALALLEEPVRSSGAEDQRRGLELIAEELADQDPQLADSARALAWSERDPSYEQTSELAARVRAALGLWNDVGERTDGESHVG
jgi:hypothetical protein